MKKILHITGSLELGGTESFIMNNYRNIDRSKYQFNFYILYPKFIHSYVDEIKSYGGKIIEGSAPVRDPFLAKQKFVKALKENGPYEAIHCHANSGNAWFLKWAKELGIPVRVSHSHANSGLLPWPISIYHKKEIKLIKEYATHFFACSKEAGDYLYGPDFFEKSGKVINNGIDLNRFLNKKSNNLIAEWNVPSDNKYILGNITRFDNNKNQTFILDIFKEFLKLEQNSLLVLGGFDFGKLSEIKEKAKSLSIDNKVRFIGARNDIEDCLNEIDAYIFPSFKEGMGLALLEAEAAGCVCLASDTIPLTTNVVESRVEYLSLNDDSAKWALKLKNLLDDRKDIGDKEIIEFFERKELTVNTMVNYLVSVYEGIK